MKEHICRYYLKTDSRICEKETRKLLKDLQMAINDRKKFSPLKGKLTSAFLPAHPRYGGVFLSNHPGRADTDRKTARQ